MKTPLLLAFWLLLAVRSLAQTTIYGLGTITAVAYTNSYAGGSPATTLYALDYRSGLLAAQSPPDGGILTAPLTTLLDITGGSPPGRYGLGTPDVVGLDIAYDLAT